MTSNDPAPSDESIRRAKLFWEQSVSDLKTSKRILRQKKTLDASFLALQATVNGLSALCHLQGEYRLPGSPKDLLRMCANLDKRFAEMDEPYEGLESLMEHSPFDPQNSAEEQTVLARQCLKEAESTLTTVKTYLKANRHRFFTP